MRVNLLCVEITCIGSYVQLTNGNVHLIEKILIAAPWDIKTIFKITLILSFKKKIVIDLKIKIISYIFKKN